MKHRFFQMMALAFLSMDTNAKETLNQTGSYKKALFNTPYQNVNLGESPIYFPTKSQKIKRKRFLAKN